MTLGQILRESREHHGFKLEDVSRRLNITQKYLIALEEGDYKVLPAKIYIHCFIKLYGNLLALNVEDLLKMYEEEAGDVNEVERVAEGRGIGKLKMMSLPRLLSALVLFVGLALFLGYIGRGVYRLVQLPPLEVEGPTNNSVTLENFVEVTGHTGNEIQVYVNNNHILANESGEFRTMVNLQKGVNIIKIVAKNRHGREATEYRKILYNIEGEEDVSVVGR